VAVLDRLLKISCFVEETAEYLRKLKDHFQVSIRRIAINAPSCPRDETLNRRRAEAAAVKRLYQGRISYFSTHSLLKYFIFMLEILVIQSNFE